jgi:hypothetical protein
VYTWKDGDKYEGRWKNGAFNGKGVKNFKDGTVFDGEWVDG